MSLHYCYLTNVLLLRITASIEAVHLNQSFLNILPLSVTFKSNLFILYT